MKFFILLSIFIVLSKGVKAQNMPSEQSLNDSVYVYYFDLFDAADIFHWGGIPQNLQIHNCKFCFKNTSEDTLIFNKITTGDGRVRYTRDGTSVVFPGEYLVVQAIHNRTDLKYRVGPFDRRLFMNASSRDSAYVFVHAFTGAYIKDSLLIHPKFMHLPDSVYPVERNDRQGYRFFEWHDKLKAADLRKKQRNGEVNVQPSTMNPPIRKVSGENWYFVHHNGILPSSRLNGMLEYKKGKASKSLDTLGQYYAFRAYKSYYSGKKKITIQEGKHLGRYVTITDLDEQFAVLNMNGAPPKRFNSEIECLEYLDKLQNYVDVRVEIGKDGTLTYQSDIEVKSNGQWERLETDENIAHAKFEGTNETYKMCIRWKNKDSLAWHYDWLYTNRNYIQRFEVIDAGEFLNYSTCGVEGVKYAGNRFKVKIQRGYKDIGDAQKCKDTLIWLLNWYGISGSVRRSNEVSLDERADAIRLYRALNKHFGESNVYPLVEGKYNVNYFAGSLFIDFQPQTSDTEIQRVLRSIGAFEERREDSMITELVPMRVHAQMKKGTELYYDRLLSILNDHQSIYAIYTRLNSDPILD